jgi:5-methyltetrahydrofolate--homocysteine methyltransferase
MIIVGELINSSRKTVAQAIRGGDGEAIKELARAQAERGADYIDVNAGTFVGEEPGYLSWLVQTVQSAVDLPCCLDSPDPRAIEAAVSVHQGTPMINSISLEKSRFEGLISLLAGTGFKVVALCMSDDGMPETSQDRLSIAGELIDRLEQHNVPSENVFVDPLVQPIGTNQGYGLAFLQAVEAIRGRFEPVHTMCGLSNISFGLPRRGFLNQTFMVLAIGRGLDGAIINPLDKRMMASILAAETLVGRDEYCMSYLDGYRAGLLEPPEPGSGS